MFEYWFPMPAGDILKDKIAHGLEQPCHDPPLIWLLVLLISLKLAASWLWSPSNSMVRAKKWTINEAYANSPPIDTLTLIIIPNMNMLCPSIFTRVEFWHLFYYFFSSIAITNITLHQLCQGFVESTMHILIMNNQETKLKFLEFDKRTS